MAKGCPRRTLNLWLPITKVPVVLLGCGTAAASAGTRESLGAPPQNSMRKQQCPISGVYEHRGEKCSQAGREG